MYDKQWIEIKTDWFYHSSQYKAQFCIEKNNLSGELSWIFRVKVDKKPILHPLTMPANTYHEGLWEYDVAEWFIADPATGKYVEFNLAPTGAWWMMVFSALRQREERLLPDISTIKASGVIKYDSWSACLEVPISVLEEVLGGVALKHNACFILGHNPREYLSWTRLSAKHPDFHRPVDFLFTLQ